MDDFLTTLYQKYFEAVQTVETLAKERDLKGECESCGHSHLDAHARDMQIARFDLSTWETLISQYLERFSTKPGKLAAMPTNSGINRNRS